jgi:hypothetical protein
MAREHTFEQGCAGTAGCSGHRAILPTQFSADYTIRKCAGLISDRDASQFSTHQAFCASAMNMWRAAVAAARKYSKRKVLAFFFQQRDSASLLRVQRSFYDNDS